MENSVVTIRHDAFGRFEVVRRKCEQGLQCKWCEEPAKFQYGYRPDDSGHINWDINLRTDRPNCFCSRTCFDEFHSD